MINFARPKLFLGSLLLALFAMPLAAQLTPACKAPSKTTQVGAYRERTSKLSTRVRSRPAKALPAAMDYTASINCHRACIPSAWTRRDLKQRTDDVVIAPDLPRTADVTLELGSVQETVP